MNALQVEQKVQQVIQSQSIGSIIDAEPILLDLLKLAASQNNRAERWQMYETLKYACSQFVGWHATNPAIRDSDSYSQIIEALDLLLPAPEIDDETQEDLDRAQSLQQLRDGILRINPTIKLPGHRSDDLGPVDFNDLLRDLAGGKGQTDG